MVACWFKSITLALVIAALAIPDLSFAATPCTTCKSAALRRAIAGSLTTPHSYPSFGSRPCSTCRSERLRIAMERGSGLAIPVPSAASRPCTTCKSDKHGHILGHPAPADVLKHPHS